MLKLKTSDHVSVELEITSNGYGDPYALAYESNMELGVIIHR